MGARATERQDRFSAATPRSGREFVRARLPVEGPSGRNDRSLSRGGGNGGLGRAWRVHSLGAPRSTTKRQRRATRSDREPNTLHVAPEADRSALQRREPGSASVSGEANPLPNVGNQRKREYSSLTIRVCRRQPDASSVFGLVQKATGAGSSKRGAALLSQCRASGRAHGCRRAVMPLARYRTLVVSLVNSPGSLRV